MKPLKALISKNTIHRAHTDVLVEINNFTYEDAITPGNIVLLKSADYDDHHGIILNEDQTSKLVHYPIPGICIAVLCSNDVSFWNISKPEQFPYVGKYMNAMIVKVYEGTYFAKRIKSKQDIINIYKKYKLIPIQL